MDQFVLIVTTLLLLSHFSCVHHVPLSMGFSRQEYWSGLPFPPPGDLLGLEVKPTSPALAAFTWSQRTKTRMFIGKDIRSFGKIKDRKE